MEIIVGFVVVFIIIAIMYMGTLGTQTESDPFIPPTEEPKEQPEQFDKSQGYVEIRFKRVNPQDNSVDEGIYLLDSFNTLEELYEKINCGLMTIGYTDKCLETYFGVDDE